MQCYSRSPIGVPTPLHKVNVAGQHVWHPHSHRSNRPFKARSKQTCVSTRCRNVQSEGHVVLCSPRSHPFAFSAQVLRALEVLEVSGGTDVHSHFRRLLAAVLDHPASPRHRRRSKESGSSSPHTWLRRRSAFDRSSLTNPHVLQPSSRTRAAAGGVQKLAHGYDDNTQGMRGQRATCAC